MNFYIANPWVQLSHWDQGERDWFCSLPPPIIIILFKFLFSLVKLYTQVLSGSQNPFPFETEFFLLVSYMYEFVLKVWFSVKDENAESPDEIDIP